MRRFFSEQEKKWEINWEAYKFESLFIYVRDGMYDFNPSQLMQSRMQSQKGEGGGLWVPCAVPERLSPFYSMTIFKKFPLPFLLFCVSFCFPPSFLFLFKRKIKNRRKMIDDRLTEGLSEGLSTIATGPWQPISRPYLHPSKREVSVSCKRPSKTREFFLFSSIKDVWRRRRTRRRS